MGSSRLYTKGSNTFWFNICNRDAFLDLILSLSVVQEVSGSKLLTTEEKAMLKINEVDFTKVTSVSAYLPYTILYAFGFAKLFLICTSNVKYCY